MLKVFRGWVQRYFSDEEAVVLAVVLALGFAIVISFGDKLAPLLTGVVLAYLLQGAGIAAAALAAARPGSLDCVSAVSRCVGGAVRRAGATGLEADAESVQRAAGNDRLVA